uniref:carboxypeptidase-like regulatory domain-containing protein n=1 Tax=Granulicella tundricola TaxID=940615 RepID=UPI0001DB792B|nr:carboxypeptidase-like regulatory domain-containing protein [Granulicella tundricola]
MNPFIKQAKYGLIFSALALTHTMSAQTFRGGIAGAVQDATGSVVPNAKITLTGTDTGSKRETFSSSSGDYSLQDLPLGMYSVTVESSGFATLKIDKISVQPGQIYSLEIKMKVASSNEQVTVDAAAVTIDTVSSTNNSVVNDKAVQNIPLNGRDFTQLVKIVPGYNGAGSMNGTRTNQNNWQIDGADNNDIWQNAAAANQGGVGSIAGVTIPIDAIDQFTVQTQGNAEVGRNGGGLISLAINLAPITFTALLTTSTATSFLRHVDPSWQHRRASLRCAISSSAVPSADQLSKTSCSSLRPMSVRNT